MKDYVTLGRSGLRISPLCLGTVTFGLEWGWGIDEITSRAIFDDYLESGGNFIDTSDSYTNGTSEKWLGKFVNERGLRDRVVIGTKFTANTDADNPNAGGNGRKNIYRALEGSLCRLKTDYIDLYWMHSWDTVTPLEEVVSTLDDLVRDGKIRHYGFSDVPAWYAARAQTLAEQQRRDHFVAFQLEYSLVERNIEREHIPAAQELGIAVCPYSPLAMGFLSGKYRREGTGEHSEGRLAKMTYSSSKRFTERNWCILDEVLDVARQIGKTPAQIALNWVVTQPGVTSTLIGATAVPQLRENLEAISFSIPPDVRPRLDRVGALEPVYPYIYFGHEEIATINGGRSVKPWSPARVS